MVLAVERVCRLWVLSICSSVNRVVLISAILQNLRTKTAITLIRQAGSRSSHTKNVTNPTITIHYFRKLTQTVNKLKIETSISLRTRDEEVEIYGKPDCWRFG